MTVRRHHLPLATTAAIELIDITDRVRDWVRRSDIRDGILTVMSLHTTARVHLNERDPALQADMVDFLTRLVPPDAAYRHNLDTVDDRANAHAHLLGLFINAAESIVVADGDLVLGQWQALFFIELDGPRAQRQVLLQLLGDG